MVLQSILPSLKSRPLTQNAQTSPFVGLAELIHSNFSLSTWIMVGACLQAFISVAFENSNYALLPAATILFLRVVDALMIHFDLKRNPYLVGSIIKKRTTAVVPDMDGNLVAPGSQKIVILLLGAKSNHPFGFLAPEFMKTFKWLAEMNASFDGARPNGFLGQTNWQRKDERGAMEFVFISYWRDIESLHTFAHGPLHRQAWLWWEKTIKLHDFVGINHEIYEAEPGHWENMYANFQPTGLGATTYLHRGNGEVEGGSVGDEWISPLIDASKGRFKASSGRLGMEATKFDRDRPDGDVYG